MKKIITVMLLSAISVIFPAAHSMAQPFDSSLLVGIWHVKNLSVAFPETMSREEKAIGAETVADDEKDFRKAAFVFTQDHQLTVGDKKFTWTIDASGTRVTVQRSNKPDIVGTLVELSANKLVFTRPDEGMTVTYSLYC